MKLLVTDRLLDVAKSNKAIGVYSMDPREFLELTTNKPVTQWVNEEPNLPLSDYNKFVRDGKTIVMPFLQVDIGTGKVLEHEGRHRAAALMVESSEKLDVAITLRKNGYPIYYEQPWIDSYDNPKQFTKRFLSSDDLPLSFLGQFKYYKHSVMLRNFKPFYPTTQLSALARLSATRHSESAALKDVVAFIQHTAKSFLGDCKFEPPNGVTLDGNQLVLTVEHTNSSLKAQGMFAKTLRNASLSHNVVETGLSTSGGKNYIRIALEKP